MSPPCAALMKTHNSYLCQFFLLFYIRLRTDEIENEKMTGGILNNVRDTDSDTPEWNSQRRVQIWSPAITIVSNLGGKKINKSLILMNGRTKKAVKNC